MKSRLFISAIGIPIIIAFVMYGGLPFVLALSIVGGLGSWETSRMLIYRDVFSNPKICFIFSLANIASVYYLISLTNLENIIAVSLLFSALFSILWLSTDFLKTSNSLNKILGILCPTFYVSGLMSFAVLIADQPYGKQWLIVLLLSTWAIDSGSFTIGKLIGKTPFFKKISPNKTIEGAIAGYVFGIPSTILGIIFLIPWEHLNYISDSTIINLSSIFIFGIFISTSSQIGDLIASLIKRKSGVKNSSGMMKAHGGVLDRIDSIELNLVVLYYFVAWMVI